MKPSSILMDILKTRSPSTFRQLIPVKGSFVLKSLHFVLDICILNKKYRVGKSSISGGKNPSKQELKWPFSGFGIRKNLVLPFRPFVHKYRLYVLEI